MVPRRRMPAGEICFGGWARALARDALHAAGCCEARPCVYVCVPIEARSREVTA